MTVPDPIVRQAYRERLEDLLLEYASYDNAAELFQHDLTCACRELEHYFSKQLHTVSSIRTQNS
ncbi:hypothetical protein SCRES3_gp59 [Synechococcus phage S-CRES3]|nr:hypothetical protein SCRES3_gp59 [Synechococcus phage S-CRES3]